MDHCLNQFQFYLAQQRNFTTGGSTYATWGDTFNQGWVVNDSTNETEFQVQGFKNIELHGIKLVGNVQCPITGGNKGIVDDYAFNFVLTGQNPSISGTFISNGYAVDQNVNEIRLTKFQNEIMFPDPIKSVTNIKIQNFQAQGYVPNNANTLTLNLILQIYFYYKYEGEEFAFL